MKSLNKYFYDNCHKNTELIGLEVYTKDSEKYYITDFDAFCNDASLPRTVFVSEKIGSDFGVFVDSSDLLVK